MVSMNGKMDNVLATLAERRGERRVAGWFGGTVAGSVVSLVVAWITGKLHQ